MRVVDLRSMAGDPVSVRLTPGAWAATVMKRRGELPGLPAGRFGPLRGRDVRRAPLAFDAIVPDADVPPLCASGLSRVTLPPVQGSRALGHESSREKSAPRDFGRNEVKAWADVNESMGAIFILGDR